MSNQTVLNGSY